jgi:D-beta-D-heptose 7-phosphate kinase/D-beta-D-heptose 1-phosphate adenosyltransferase
MQHQAALQNKITSKEVLSKTLAAKRLYGHKIVFTNGCFDLLHPGHLRYLAQARDLGNYLVIGLNSDDSVSRLKGPKRPIQKESIRAEMLAALHVVDAVVVFDEDTPLELISYLKPDILVKGGDYTPETVVGADVVTQYGGRVEIIQFEEGFSTTDLIAQIKNG